MKKFVIILLLFAGFLSPAFAEVAFLTPADEDLYSRFTDEIRSRNTKLLNDKIDFYNVWVDKTCLDKSFYNKTLLYVEENELKNVLKQNSSGLSPSSLRVASVYTGLGLVNAGYQAYNQNFNNFKVTFSKPPKDYLAVKPEIIVLDWRYDRRGPLKTNIVAAVDMVVQISVFDSNKQIFQKIYKVNNVETDLSELLKTRKIKNVGFTSTFPAIAFAKALNLIYRKNIQDLSEILN